MDDSYALTSGIFWNKSITVNKRFFMLSEAEQAAVISHEMGHVKGFHIEQRILCFFLFPPALFWLCRRQ